MQSCDSLNVSESEKPSVATSENFPDYSLKTTGAERNIRPHKLEALSKICYRRPNSPTTLSA